MLSDREKGCMETQLRDERKDTRSGRVSSTKFGQGGRRKGVQRVLCWSKS